MALSLTWQGPLSLHHTDYPRGSLGNLIAWWLASRRASGTRKHAGSYNVFYDLDLEVILHYFCKIMSVTQAALVSAGGTYPGLQITGCHLQGWLLSLPHLLPVEAKITRHLREKKGQTELLCRTDADSQTLKNLWSPKETVWGVGGCTGVVGWKSYKIGL